MQFLEIPLVFKFLSLLFLRKNTIKKKSSKTISTDAMDELKEDFDQKRCDIDQGKTRMKDPRVSYN